MVTLLRTVEYWASGRGTIRVFVTRYKESCNAQYSGLAPDGTTRIYMHIVELLKIYTTTATRRDNVI